MNLEKIKEVVNSQTESVVKERQIIAILSEDKNVIPTMLAILAKEREDTNKLISDSNFELSRALVTLVEPDLKKTTGGFVIGQIKAHFHKWQHRVSCCFKFDDLPE